MRTTGIICGTIYTLMLAAASSASAQQTPRPDLVQPRIKIAQSSKCSERGSLPACIACMQNIGRSYGVAEAFCMKYYNK